MIELKGPANQHLKVGLVEFGPEGSPGEGDLLLDVTASVGGYSAADQSWVVEGDWRRFLGEMKELELTRRGEATLVGASEDDLRIRFRITDRAGHTEVVGHLSWMMPKGYRQRLEFGFPFDAGVLATLLSQLEAIKK